MAVPSPIGATLAGKYEVRRMIGRGGMGAVYEGLHIDIGKRVAIKLLETEHSKAEEIAERFRREGRAASRVESEHVVQVFDVGQDATHGLYMVMEYLDGEDLAKRLERERIIDLPQAIDIAWQAARGLAKAHAAGVIHRDLKPGNIFLAQRDDGLTSVKIVDFGISKLVSGLEELKGAITRHGSAVGTPQYMSPEQAQGFPIDHRTDVWALGCVFYEMLAGKQAYELKENYEQTIFAIVLRKPPPLSETAPWVPEPIVAIVNKALEHDVDARIADCGTFARMLAETARSLDLVTRAGAGNAPLALMRRMTGSNPRIDLDELDSSVVVVAPGSSPVVSRATAAATAPAMNAVETDSMSRMQAYQQPPTVTGVAVKTGHYPSVHPDPIEELPAKRSTGGAIIAVLLLGALSAAAAFVMVRGNPFEQRQTPSVAASPAPLTIPSPEPIAVPPPSASIEAPQPSAVPSSSASARPSASTKPTKPGPHHAVAAPSASASAAPSQKPPTGGDDQFGGVGVSNSY
jgi:serine/threonine protein kinase